GVVVRGEVVGHGTPGKTHRYFKSAGTGIVTWPVAAHSVPRVSVRRKPGLSMAFTSWPSAVWNTRPVPYLTVQIRGSSFPVPQPSPGFQQFLGSSKAVARM